MRFSSPAGPLGKQAALIPVLTQPFSFLLSTKSLGRETKTLFLVPPTTCAPWAGRHSTPFSSSPGITWHWRKAQLGEKLTWLQFGITQVQYLRVAPGGFNNLLEYSADPSTHRSAASFSFSFCLQSEKELIHQRSPAPAPAPAPNAAHGEQQQEAP